jgi:hypothetical protein
MAVAYRVSGRVPDALVPQVDGGPMVPVRGRPREAVALLFPDARPGWVDYIREMHDLARELADWDGRVIAVTPAGEPAIPWAEVARELGPEVWLVLDPEGFLAPAAALPAAAVVDRYGEIYHVWERDHEDARPGPPPRELEEWLRFLALQCPE